MKKEAGPVRKQQEQRSQRRECVTSANSVRACTLYTDGVKLEASTTRCTFYVSLQVGSVHDYLGRGLHLQVPPQPGGLLQGGAGDGADGLHHLMGHVLQTRIGILQDELIQYSREKEEHVK
ncbi:hypothetical protein EYF80_032094 [Liparis tanakae]|uniref:Uncharacterized protein n=1 Tax=Liparis tanakae TaxID=230148 RepID=A0A4Z2GW27_9TELE|nr:hypothetical protein EYF80_032094 [Liparis tanakae]